MWFKNLAVYRFTEPFTTSVDEFEEKLQEKRFRPCGSHDESSLGWTAPLGKGAEQLVHAANGFFMVALKKEEKVVPAAVVNEMLQEKIDDIEEREARKLARKERTRIKDELIFELLPKAFAFSRKTYAYIDPKGGWIVVDAAAAKKAEDLLSTLRQCLGSLPVVPLNTAENPVAIMTDWLMNQTSPGDISIEDECELRSQSDEGAIVRCKRHDLTLPEIKNHLDNDKQVIKLALNWADRLSFLLDEHLAVKRLKFLDLIQDQVADIDAGTDVERFDADFSIMTMELANFLPRLVELFGGENQT
ncbi:recombination-associated protein RdgC [Methylomarinum vadi]|uniref:recombination-associated protein RdgC n=1 Tax=Methylomarinum vadi TaxID=438855 RepID=UPI0004DF91DC|nr:recombination-associated protein RdgC [Methylomarinum vadi]